MEEKNAEVFYGLPKCIQLIIKENKEDFWDKSLQLIYEQLVRNEVEPLYAISYQLPFLGN